MITREDLINDMVLDGLIPDYVAKEWIGVSRPTRGDLTKLLQGIDNKIDKSGRVNTMTYANFVDYHINQAYVDYLCAHNILIQAMREPFFNHDWDLFIASSKKMQKELLISFTKDSMETWKDEISNDNRFSELAMFAKNSISILYLVHIIRYESECDAAWNIYSPKTYSSFLKLLTEGWENKMLQKSYIKMLNLPKDTFKNYKEKALDQEYKMQFGPKSINQMNYYRYGSSLPYYVLNKDEWQKARMIQYDKFASQFCKYEGIKIMKHSALKKYCFKSLKKSIEFSL